MTDQQLALLLQSYAQRLRAELVALSDRLPVELEREMELWDKERDTRVIPDWWARNSARKESERCEWRPTGAPIAFNDLWEFVWELEEAVEKLSEPSSLEEAKNV